MTQGLDLWPLALIWPCGFISNRAGWWAWQVSNLRPTGYEPVALPLSYRPATVSLSLCVKWCQEIPSLSLYSGSQVAI